MHFGPQIVRSKSTKRIETKNREEKVETYLYDVVSTYTFQSLLVVVNLKEFRSINAVDFYCFTSYSIRSGALLHTIYHCNEMKKLKTACEEYNF